MFKFNTVVLFLVITAAFIFAEQTNIFLELKSQLSPRAQVIFPDDLEFQNVTARWSIYKRPTFRAAILVATEEDVIETVRYSYIIFFFFLRLAN
jgi:hypothetical protein